MPWTAAKPAAATVAGRRSAPTADTLHSAVRPRTRSPVTATIAAKCSCGTGRLPPPSLVSVATDGTQGNHWSSRSSVSADARYVAFVARASNLAPGDTNEAWDVFVHGECIRFFRTGRDPR